MLLNLTCYWKDSLFDVRQLHLLSLTHHAIIGLLWPWKLSQQFREHPVCLLLGHKPRKESQSKNKHNTGFKKRHERKKASHKETLLCLAEPMILKHWSVHTWWSLSCREQHWAFFCNVQQLWRHLQRVLHRSTMHFICSTFIYSSLCIWTVCLISGQIEMAVTKHWFCFCKQFS